MIDFDRIPKEVYDELVSLIGEQKAQECVKNNNYNYRMISNIIFFYRAKMICKRYPLQIVFILLLLILLFWFL